MSAIFEMRKDSLERLQGQVIVVLGGAQGIGACIGKISADHGAHVVLGDLNAAAGEQMARSLRNATFVQTDVSSYDSIVALLETALAKHGAVDHAINTAAVDDMSDADHQLIPGDLSIDSVKSDPKNLDKIIDVNLKGSARFARVATAFLKHNIDTKRGKRSVFLFSSDAMLLGVPSGALYQTSKEGVLGLMRNLSIQSLTRDGIRINAVMPDLVRTQFAGPFPPIFEQAGLTVLEPEEVARVVLEACAREDVHGAALHMAAGRVMDLSRSYKEAEVACLGKEFIDFRTKAATLW